MRTVGSFGVGAAGGSGSAIASRSRVPGSSKRSRIGSGFVDWPSRIMLPSRRVTVPVTGWPSMKVPLGEPRSSRWTPASSQKTRTWTREMERSWSGSGESACRPSFHSSPGGISFAPSV